MADTGIKYPATVITIQETGDDNDWTTPAEVVSDNGVYGEITAASFDANDLSYLLKATNPSMGVPAGATINGILVEIERHYANGTVADEDVCLTKDGSARVGDDKSTAAAFPATDAITSFGGATDLWGTTWTVDEINATTFGVLYKMKATGANADGFVDFIRITVYYTAAAIEYLAGVISGTSTVTGAIRVSKKIGGTISGVSTVSGMARISKKIAGTIAGVSTVSGGVKVSKKIAGVISGVSTVAGDLTVTGGGAIEYLAGVIGGGSSVTGTMYKPSTNPPFSSAVHAIMYDLTFANTTERDQMASDIDAWLVGKEEWGTGGNAKVHGQSGNTDKLVVRLVNQSDMDTLMAYIESRCAAIPVSSGRVAKHWCGHAVNESCEEIEVLTW